MKAVVAAFNQEKALVGAFSVITNLRRQLFEVLMAIYLQQMYDNISSLYSQTVPTGSALSQSQGGSSPSHGAGGGAGAGQLGAGFNSSKYTQLLAVIEEIGKDIRPTYAGNKSSAERLKRGIVHARILVREALMEAERSARQ